MSPLQRFKPQTTSPCLQHVSWHTKFGQDRLSHTSPTHSLFDRFRWNPAPNVKQCLSYSGPCYCRSIGNQFFGHAGITILYKARRIFLLKKTGIDGKVTSYIQSRHQSYRQQKLSCLLGSYLHRLDFHFPFKPSLVTPSYYSSVRTRFANAGFSFANIQYTDLCAGCRKKQCQFVCVASPIKIKRKTDGHFTEHVSHRTL